MLKPRSPAAMRSHRFLGILIVAAAACSAWQPHSGDPVSQNSDGYAARTSYSLTPGPDHMAGRIELLEDARIRPAMQKAITEAYGGDPCENGSDTVLKSLCTPGHAALRPAVLRLLDARGRVLATQVAERPLANLAVATLYGSPRRSYMFTVDLSAEMGSYSGPYTRLAEPDGRSFGWLVADSAGVADTITLVSTLKTDWRAVARPDGRGDDLLMVRCRPDLSVRDSAAFVLTFQRFTFDGQRWMLYSRQEPGCYESDEPFPARSKFP